MTNKDILFLNPFENFLFWCDSIWFFIQCTLSGIFVYMSLPRVEQSQGSAKINLTQVGVLWAKKTLLKSAATIFNWSLNRTFKWDTFHPNSSRDWKLLIFESGGLKNYLSRIAIKPNLSLKKWAWLHLGDDYALLTEKL